MRHHADPHDAFAFRRRLKRLRVVRLRQFREAVVFNSAQTLFKGDGITAGQCNRGVPSFMPVYRIYKLDAQGHVTGPALILICEKDADVIRKVESLVDGHDVEILEGARLVGRLKSLASYPTNHGQLPMPVAPMPVSRVFWWG
jgi:hypothetical protein